MVQQQQRPLAFVVQQPLRLVQQQQPLRILGQQQQQPLRILGQQQQQQSVVAPPQNVIPNIPEVDESGVEAY